MRKSVFTGVIIGLILTILLLYPALVLFVGRILPGIGTPLEQMLGEIPLLGNVRVSMTLPLIMALVSIASMVGLCIGSIPAMRANANSLVGGMNAGALSGLFTGLVIFIFLVAPTATVISGAQLLSFGNDSLPNIRFEYPIDLVIPFARFVLIDELWFLLATAVGGCIIGGMEGGIVGMLRRRHHPPESPASLLDCIDDRHGRRIWFQNYEEPVFAGLFTGILGGLILLLVDVINQSASSNATDPQSQWISMIFQKAANTQQLDQAHLVVLPVLLVLAFIVVIGVGGIAALVTKNPPTYLRSRVFAAMVAGTMVGLILSMPASGYIRFLIVLLPQLNRMAPPLPDAIDWMQVLNAMPVRVLLLYLFPLMVTALITAGLMIWGILQGTLYSFIFSMFRLRPVDRARIVRQEILQRGDAFLPRLYSIFQYDRQALMVMEHLAFDLRKDPDKARMVAAFHTLSTRPEQSVRALESIARTLEAHPEWKLRSEILVLQNMLAQGLRAKTLAQVTLISPAPEDQTSSLLPVLAKTGDYLSKPLTELKKVERVDDLNSKIVFLSNALEALRQARRFQEDQTKGTCACTLPEISILRVLLDHWEGIILSSIRDIQGRAEIEAELKTKKVTYAPELSLTLSLANHGLNVAETVCLRVDESSDDYHIVEGGQQKFDILPAQDEREITFAIRPQKEKGCLRIGWKITYGDALKEDYVLEFADQVEFMEVEKPFQRIFPIPYVTGTPLQSSEMFVGRRDVFAFIHEHLFGKYQNNVLVLHGQRRTGKSSILYHLGSELAETHLCVLIDMQGKAARGEVDFLYSIADDIVYALENQGILVDLPPRKDFEESPEFFFRSRFLRCVVDALGNKNLLLMFDEFEELQKRVEDGKLSADIFPYLRNLMQHERRVDFIFAGTHKLEELAAEYWSILFNIAIYKRITFLDPAEVAWLATQPVANSGMEYDSLAVERIYQVASGHPYFTQVICHEMVAYHNETQRSYMTVTDVENALDRILERGEAHFKYIWAESSTNQRLASLALAEFLETEDAAVPEDLQNILEKRGRPLGKEELAEALGNLEARDILLRSDPRSNLYRFRVDLIRRWLYITRPTYEKVR